MVVLGFIYFLVRNISIKRKGREKVLILGGAIANFTDVAKTFTGIIQDRHRAYGIREVGRRYGKIIY